MTTNTLFDLLPSVRNERTERIKADLRAFLAAQAAEGRSRINLDNLRLFLQLRLSEDLAASKHNRSEWRELNRRFNLAIDSWCERLKREGKSY